MQKLPATHLTRALRWVFSIAAIGVAIIAYQNPVLPQPQHLSATFIELGNMVWLCYGALSILCAMLLLPSMPLVIAASSSFAAQPLSAWLLAMFGVLCSSLSIYYFSDRLGFAERMQQQPKLEATRALIQRFGAPVLAVWSFTPFLPTDLACYVAAAARMPFWRYLIATCIGEGVLCASIVAGAHWLVAYY
jgi:uncharacterized membrane protein YdjX (TVP38/TMEM64 family)